MVLLDNEANVVWFLVVPILLLLFVGVLGLVVWRSRSIGLALKLALSVLFIVNAGVVVSIVNSVFGCVAC